MAGTIPKFNLNNAGDLNGGPYKNPDGFKKTMQNVMFYEKALLQSLKLTEPGKWNAHMKHVQMPMHIGDGISVRRYLGLEADPSKLLLTKDGYDAPAPKTMAGVAVTATLNWYGNTLGANDYVLETELDDLMPIYLRMMTENANEVMDNIAAAETVKGASKVYLGKTTAQTGKALPWVKAYLNPTDAKSTIDAYGVLDINTIRKIISRFKTNIETYQGVIDGKWGDDPLIKGTVRVKAPIKPVLGGNYLVLCSESAKNDLLNDPIYRSDFIRGISAQTLLSNTVPTMFGFTVQTVENKITAQVNADPTKGAPATDMQWGGNLDVSIVIGQEYAMDVTLAGQGVKLKQKPIDQTTTSDPLGRIAIIGYKLIYAAKVLNTMAVYAIYSKPGLSLADTDVHEPVAPDFSPVK